jgi:hypothetical protein
MNDDIIQQALDTVNKIVDMRLKLIELLREIMRQLPQYQIDDLNVLIEEGTIYEIREFLEENRVKRELKESE